MAAGMQSLGQLWCQTAAPGSHYQGLVVNPREVYCAATLYSYDALIHVSIWCGVPAARQLAKQ